MQLSYNLNSAPGGTLSGLQITTTSLANPRNKGVSMGVGAPPGYDITGVHVCYQDTNSASYVNGIRLAQVQDPPSSASVLLDDRTPLNAAGATCYNTTSGTVAPLHASAGEVYLSLYLTFASVSDTITLRGIGLDLVPS